VWGSRRWPHPKAKHAATKYRPPATDSLAKSKVRLVPLRDASGILQAGVSGLEVFPGEKEREPRPHRSPGIRGTGAGLARLFLGGAAGPGLEVEGRADRLPALTGAFDWTPSS
jgi:hypothetical protein